MPDNILQIGASVDVAQLNAGMQQATASAREAGSEMSEAFQQLAAESEAATTQISSAWVRAAESSVVYAKAKDQVRAASRAAKQADDDSTGALFQLALAQQRAAAAAAELAIAQKATAGATEEVAAAARHVVPEMAASSAAIRVFEGTVPIRAVERFLSTTLGLGPVLRAAFPVIGAVALGEVLVELGAKIWKTIDDFINLKTAQEEVIEVEDRLGRAATAAFQKAQDAAVEHLRNIGHAVDAARLHLQNLQSEPIDLGQFLKTTEIDEKLKQLPQEMREQLKNTFASITPADVAPLTERLKTEIAKANGEAAALTEHQKHQGILMSAFTERGINQEKTLSEIYSGLLQFLNEEQQKYAGETVVATDGVAKAHEEEARRIREATQQQATELRRADEEALSALKLRAAQEGVTGQALLQQERALLSQRLAAETGNADRVRELRSELDRVTIESLGEFARAQKLASEGLRQGMEEANRYQAALQKADETETRLFTEGLKREQERLAKQQAVDKARLDGAIQYEEQQLQMQRAQLERQQALGGGSFNPFGGGEVEGLRQQQEIEEKILALKVEQARIDAELESDPAKREADLNKLAQLQSQYNLKVYQDHTQMLQLERQQYQQFFSMITEDLNRGVNQWIAGQKRFSQAMAESWNSMVQNVVTNLEKMVEQWAANELIMTLVHTTANETRVASDASAAAQSSAINATTTLQKVTSDAVSAASGAFQAVVGIPVVGPVLAPAAAAAAFAAVEAFGALAHFEQGGMVPRTGIAMLHQGENVTSAPLTKMLMNAASAPASNAYGDVHVHYNPTINGGGSGNMKQLLSDHADHIGRIVQSQMRTFNR